MDDYLKAEEIVTQAELEVKGTEIIPHSWALGVLMAKYD
jgi:hypothetical protein